ncbi:hypothetical protein Patl1_11498 [Pistacia atlantica]|uniref:Uncharacterized protein n=1 Tax=Pistacia atlantica TaxID=434234 RepID=A0ACC1A5X8_9ROSI|nr:hypothetical protein Patl1_11498 [Pistacia atlantica]
MSMIVLVRFLQKSSSSVEELARVVVEKKGVPDIIGRAFSFSFLDSCPSFNNKTELKAFPVNSAGTINKNNRIWEVPPEEFDTVIDTNVKGIANVLCHFIPLMITKKQGIVVNMSYGLSRSVAKELLDGMAVVALNPVVINTDMLASCFGTSAALYQAPDAWALKAATMILNLTGAENGASLTV